MAEESEFSFSDEKNVEVQLDFTDEYSPRKVYINRVDDYHGRHISNFLANQPVGGPGETQENETDELQLQSEGSDLDTTSQIHNKTDESPKYIVIGTSKSMNFEKPEEIAALVDDTDRSSLLTKLLGCKYIIYDISENPNQVNEAKWAIEALDKEITAKKENGETSEPLNFILISTVLTWALTKPIDPEEPNEPFTEDDYRLRRAHLNYKNHLALEKEVIKIGKKHKKQLKTTVVACGLVYGLEENLMGILFKLAWLHEPFLPYFPPGNNYVPLLHITDLSKIIYHLIKSMPRKRWYILALEETVSTLKDITKAISNALGSGKLGKTTKEEALALKDMTEEGYNHMTMNLNMQPRYILENMPLEYVPDDNELNFLENIENITAEFVKIHGLKPIKIFIHGPPMSGKTFLANRICRHYQLHYLTLENVLQDFNDKMEEKLRALEKKEQASQKSSSSTEKEDENDDETDNEDDNEELMELYQSLQEAKSENISQEEDVIIKILKEKLHSKACQKQGFVLDGFPKTYEQAKILFSLNDDDDEEDEEMEDEEDEVPIAAKIDNKIIPDHVFNLEANNNLLFKRAAKVPPERNTDSRYDEENMKNILREFRILNTDANTVMNFFDEVEHYPENISVMEDERPLLEKAFQKMLTIIGSPSNLGPLGDEEEKISPEEKALIQLQKEEILKELLEKERLEKIQQRRKKEEWAKSLLITKLEEERKLEAKAVPIREYLTKEVFPFLKPGLLEIYRLKPKDPVDYLAEYLFTHYIDGKFFPPEPPVTNEDQLSSLIHMFKCFDQQ